MVLEYSSDGRNFAPLDQVSFYANELNKDGDEDDDEDVMSRCRRERHERVYANLWLLLASCPVDGFVTRASTRLAIKTNLDLIPPALKGGQKNP